MWEFIFSSVWGWIGTAGVIVIIGLVVSYFIPAWRPYALGAIGLVVSVATIYTKGSRDRAALERKRKEEAVAKAQKDYAEIDSRPDTADTLADKLRNGRF